MNWITRYWSSSIGRKQIMAKTGLLLCGFLIVHLAGNMLLYAGPEAFNAYAAKLTSNKFLLIPAEIVLFSIFGVHIALAMKLTLENRQARGGVRYAVNTQSGDMNIATKTMPITGIWTFIFLALHLINFKFANHDVENGLYGVVQSHFQNPVWSLYYIVSMALLGLHVGHGVQSAFQTYGLTHPKWEAIIKNASIAFGLLVFVGYSSFPVYFFIKG
jgi:succinate dehydrogenase / fumarate reductase cytochrome b subunit